MIAWKKENELVLEKGEPIFPINNYIADCIYRIATRLSYRPNFINYSYKEEMVGDGLVDCIRYVDRFNPEKSENPFAYFTQIAYNAYIRRIKKEKRQSEIRNKMIRSEVKTYYTMQEMFPDETVYPCLTQSFENKSYSMSEPILPKPP